MKYFRNKIVDGCFAFMKIDDSGQQWTLAWEGMGYDYGVDNERKFWIKGGFANRYCEYDWVEINDLAVLVLIGIDNYEYADEMI